MDSESISVVLELFKEGGALVILGAVLYLIAMRMIPAFLKALTEQRTEFIAALHDTEEHHEKTITTLTHSNEKIMGDMRNDSQERLELIRQMLNGEK